MPLIQDSPVLLSDPANLPVFSVPVTDAVLDEESQTERRLLQHSPYVETPHLLDLETLDHENVLLARALIRMRNVRADYATAPYLDSFNWAELFEDLQRLVVESGLPFKSTSWYIVAFRSQIPPTTKYAELGTLDKAAHAEANASGGFLKYVPCAGALSLARFWPLTKHDADTGSAPRMWTVATWPPACGGARKKPPTAAGVRHIGKLRGPRTICIRFGRSIGTG